MMASNILSRLLPSASDEPFDLPTVNAQDRRRSSAGDHPQMDIDEENLEARFEAQDLENLLADASASHMTSESTAFLPQNNDPKSIRPPPAARGEGQWRQPGPPASATIDDDDDVPESLLLEGAHDPPTAGPSRHRGEGLPPPVPGPSSRRTRAQWETTRRQQRLHDEGPEVSASPKWQFGSRPGQFAMDPKEKAMWLWVNVQDVDSFLAQVYEYYTGCGMWSMVLRRFLVQIQTAFVVGLLTFLKWCVDYPKIHEHSKMSEVLVPKCTKQIHGFFIFALWLFFIWFAYSIIALVRDIPRLRQMHDFFHHLLDIPDRDIQTVDWQLVVARLMALRDTNALTAANLSPQARKLLDQKSRKQLDAADIASRLMRQENYLIALFNKDVLDVSVPIPFLGNRYIFSRTTEFHARIAIMDFVFGSNGKVNPDFLKERNRRTLVEKLQRRMLLTGLISIVCTPFTVIFVLASYVFKYFTEYHKDPSQLGSRDFTPFAQWRFREFNELSHIFARRRNMAYPFANHYLAQFPKDKTEQIAAFVAFVTGAFAFVLAVFTLLEPELFLAFEVTPGRTALFWLGTLTIIYRMARSSSPQEDAVADPAWYLGQVSEYTHYQPASWKGRLHTDAVRGEFAKLYQPKVVIFAEEVLSMIITPFLLIFRLPNCAERIVDFFREFSIDVDGLGVVCSFSQFNFQKSNDNVSGNRAGRQHEDSDLRADYFMAKDNKMLASYYGFMDTYGAQPRGNYNGRLQGKGSFHPPPQFPNNFGAMSGTDARAGSRGPSGRQHPRRTPRHGPTGRDEQMQSLLLDPHHQPSNLRSSPRQVAHSRYRSNLGTVADPDAERNLMRQDSRIEEESSIGESWRTSRLAEGDEEEEEGASNNRGGVLQLLQQFSKQTGTGVGI